MRIVGVGDNVLDRYVDQGLMYPGGNAVNVPVLALRFGAEAAAYVGAVGDDEGGSWLLEALGLEGLDTSRVKVLPERNSYTSVALVDGDRTFVGGEKGASSKLVLTPEDVGFIHNFDVVHTSIYSGIEGQLQELRANSRILAFDFSNEFDEAYLDRVLGSVDYAFFSGSRMFPGARDTEESELEAFLARVEDRGVRLALVTRGAKGAVLRYGGRTWRQEAVPCRVVDTLGAGDAFIARLIVGIVSGEEPSLALREAARSAAATCSYYGAFGHPRAYRPVAE